MDFLVNDLTDIFSLDFLLYILPILLIVLLPTIVSVIKGKKDLEKAIKAYAHSLDAFRNEFKNIILSEDLTTQALTIEYMFKTKEIREAVLTINLIERRTYVYYLTKIFKKMPDTAVIKVILNNPPASALYVIPRHRKKILSKIVGYLARLKEVSLGSINKNYVVTSDDPRTSKQYISREILSSILRLKENLLYLIVDYTRPNLEINFEVTEKNPDNIRDALKLIVTLSRNLSKVKSRGKETEALRFIRRSLQS